MTRRHRVSARERIARAAADLFYRQGIRGVGVETIAERAESNKMTLYRNFGSKDELIAEWLRGLVRQAETKWDGIAAAHKGDPRRQLLTWFEALVHYSVKEDRGCPFANTLAELPDPRHPARQVIECYKTAQRERFAQLCRQAGVREPHLKADALFLLLEGALASGHLADGQTLTPRLVKIARSLLASNPADFAAARSAARAPQSHGRQ
jgi:AcrR family transcriptional regulator